MDFESYKILARNSSVGCSSRINYYRSGEGVPFKWEMQPGIAKEPRKEELPPLCPPPAVVSLGLPKPCIEEPKPSTRSRILRYWMKTEKIGKNRKKVFQDHASQECSRDPDGDVEGLDIFARILDQCTSGSESMASPRDSSFSSSSSSLSIMKSARPSLQSTSSESSTREMNGRPPLRCFPMNISRILVSIARRD